MDHMLVHNRFSFRQLTELYRLPLPILGGLANAVRRAWHPAPQVTWVSGAIINYTNLCTNSCVFCAYHRTPDVADAYLMSVEEVVHRARQLQERGGTELLFQGGVHSAAGLSYYESVFSSIRDACPEITIHGLSPAEIAACARGARLTLRDTLERLHQAGLQSIAGGGAEILVDRVRRIVSPRKIGSRAWLNVMRMASEVGLPCSVTMMYGHVETIEERVEHLMKLRDLQDETGHVRAFIAWPFLPRGTQLAHLRQTGADTYLRMVALARLALDNIPHLQASYLTQGPRVVQAALHCGLDDLGSEFPEERVTSASHRAFIPAPGELAALAVRAGFTPRRRDTAYRLLD